MMKITKMVTLSLLAMVVLGTKSYAEEVKTPWYAGAGLTTGIVSDTNCEDITYGVTVQTGYKVNPNVALEFRVIKTNWEDEGGKIEHYGFFIKPNYPIVKDVNLYGLLGYAQTTLSSQANVDETGMAYGAGLTYALDEYDVFLDYEHLLQNSDVPDIDAFSLGLTYNF